MLGLCQMSYSHVELSHFQSHQIQKHGNNSGHKKKVYLCINSIARGAFTNQAHISNQHESDQVCTTTVVVNVGDISLKDFMIAFSNLQFQVIPRFGIFRKCKQLKKANSGSHPRLHGRKCNHETFGGNIYTIAYSAVTIQSQQVVS